MFQLFDTLDGVEIVTTAARYVEILTRYAVPLSVEIGDPAGSRLPTAYSGLSADGPPPRIYVFNHYGMNRTHEDIAQTLLHEGLHLVTRIQSRLPGSVILDALSESRIEDMSRSCHASAAVPFPDRPAFSTAVLPTVTTTTKPRMTPRPQPKKSDPRANTRRTKTDTLGLLMLSSAFGGSAGFSSERAVMHGVVARSHSLFAKALLPSTK